MCQAQRGRKVMGQYGWRLLLGLAGGHRIRCLSDCAGDVSDVLSQTFLLEQDQHQLQSAPHPSKCRWWTESRWKFKFQSPRGLTGVQTEGTRQAEWSVKNAIFSLWFVSNFVGSGENRSSSSEVCPIMPLQPLTSRAYGLMKLVSLWLPYRHTARKRTSD